MVHTTLLAASAARTSEAISTSISIIEEIWQVNDNQNGVNLQQHNCH